MELFRLPSTVEEDIILEASGKHALIMKEVYVISQANCFSEFQHSPLEYQCIIECALAAMLGDFEVHPLQIYMEKY